ncbi:hypothetical protein acsn021_17760 [Anaerocolumna cellulosilytica]|uniref:Putative amidase domain-containing protein n=1 Tax=Anaerocolumna cellulosilytica TaxID=433286 RepID=A0A6S6R2A0_9FIRM|nr:amidase domain-containing protein [Anaerocolumna cellulosilytica]MBB5194829.1 hypothetical protein [Anaerocolumna cellulosilytica]BCJ94207.1 hypothetical protein acsn021_17760 [Anaerocolumna cellulosilytica]
MRIKKERGINMKNKIVSVALVLMMLVGLSGKVFAKEVGATLLVPQSISLQDIVNSSTCLTDGQAQVIFDKLKERILNEYSESYNLTNFKGEFSNERTEDGSVIVDVNIYTDMTLTRHPSDSPFVKGMFEALSQVESASEKQFLDHKIDEYVKEVETLYYNKADASVFTYAIALNVNNNLLDKQEPNMEVDYDLYYRTDAEEVVLEPVIDELKVEASLVAEKNGREYVTTLQSALLKNTIQAGFYDRIAARDYAIAHATDTPEFSASNGQGSDCANFVSKALNAGGIPIDRSGGWYPSSNGKTATCGVNWMRTGYYNNGGVVPYMTGKNYFYRETALNTIFAGSIMYWTNTSHVALVTYGDGSVIKYSQHSNVKLSSSSAVNVVYKSESAYFYKPQSSIMK